MKQSRMWTFGAIVVILAVVAGTWFLGISPRLSEATQANNDRENVETQNQLHEVKIASLIEQSKNLEPLRRELAELHLSVPSDADLPLLIGQINQLAQSSGVLVSQLVPGNPTVYTPVEQPVAEGVEEPDAELSAARGGVNPESFLIIPLSINVSGTYGQVMDFVNRLQTGPRLTLVYNLSMSDGPALPDTPVELFITAQTFILLDSTPPPVEADPAIEAETTE